MDYTLEVAAEPGGVRVSVNLDKPLPEKLAGRAGFNLEFLPSVYTGKSYAVDDTHFGIIPRSPQDPMQQALPPADDPKKLPYQEEWDKDEGLHTAAFAGHRKQHYAGSRGSALPRQC